MIVKPGLKWVHMFLFGSEDLKCWIQSLKFWVLTPSKLLVSSNDFELFCLKVCVYVWSKQICVCENGSVCVIVRCFACSCVQRAFFFCTGARSSLWEGGFLPVGEGCRLCWVLRFLTISFFIVILAFSVLLQTECQGAHSRLFWPMGQMGRILGASITKLRCTVFPS